MVKANAYGHGLERGMKGFAQADGLALIETENALRLRELGWTRPILLLEGIFDASDVPLLAEHDITLAGTWCYPVHDWPRVIGLIASGRYPVQKVVTAQIPMAEVVEAGFETLLSPTGDQVKVLVEAR